ncbi:hypothetical protein KDK77_08335 [bacterium]|nr:hypothetical protein [bacterium]
MLKKLFCISVLYTIVASTSSVSVEESFSRYYAKNAPVSMEIPDGWVIETATDQYGVFDAIDSVNSRLIIVSDQYFDEKDGLDERFQLFVDELSAYEWDVKDISVGRAMLGNHPAKWVVQSHYFDTKHMIGINYVVVVGKHEYFIGGFSLAEEFEKNRPLLERIIKSTQIEK